MHGAAWQRRGPGAGRNQGAWLSVIGGGGGLVCYAEDAVKQRNSEAGVPAERALRRRELELLGAGCGCAHALVWCCCWR